MWLVTKISIIFSASEVLSIRVGKFLITTVKSLPETIWADFEKFVIFD